MLKNLIGVLKIIFTGKGNVELFYEGNLDKYKHVIQSQENSFYSRINILTSHIKLVTAGVFNMPPVFNKLTDSPEYYAEFKEETVKIKINISNYYKFFIAFHFILFIGMIIFGLQKMPASEINMKMISYFLVILISYFSQMLFIAIWNFRIFTKISHRLRNDFDLKFSLKAF